MLVLTTDSACSLTVQSSSLWWLLAAHRRSLHWLKLCLILLAAGREKLDFCYKDFLAESPEGKLLPCALLRGLRHTTNSLEWIEWCITDKNDALKVARPAGFYTPEISRCWDSLAFGGIGLWYCLLSTFPLSFSLHQSPIHSQCAVFSPRHMQIQSPDKKLKQQGPIYLAFFKTTSIEVSQTK